MLISLQNIQSVQFIILNMNKTSKEFLEEPQSSESFSLKGQPSMSMRSKNQKAGSTAQSFKTEDKKKSSAKKQSYTLPQPFHIPNPPLVQFDRFQSLYQELLRNEKQKGQLNMFNLDVLYAMYKYANVQGGLLYVSSIGNFPSIVKHILLNLPQEHMQLELTPQFIQKIRQLLYSIQFINANPNQKKKIYELGLINFVDKQQLKGHITDKVRGLEYFNYDLTLFQEGAQSIGIDKFIFNLDYMCEHYKKQKIDIRIQYPLDYGFQVSRLKNKQYEMPLGDYRYYQLNCRSLQAMKNFKHIEHLGKGQIFFGVNFQPSDQMLNKQIKKNVQNTFLDFHGDFDILSFLDTDVPGCSLPQMYFKTSGCWTGGHQENISMSALNINHGPDASQWYTLELKYIEPLRQELKKLYNFDLYISQGLWYEKIDWFLTHGYPVKRFLQRKDDIVVTGPGTLHWVRCFGTAMQTAWNIMPKNYQQIFAAFQRHKANKEIRFYKSDTIPLKSLIMRYLNHQRTIMSQKIRILCANQLEQWYQSEMSIIEEFGEKIKHKQYFYLKDLESFCCMCKQEVLVYFLAAPVQFKRGISCLECFKKDAKKNFEVDELYYKHQNFWIQALLDLCKNGAKNLAQPYQIQQLCKGVHVGKIQGECRVAKQSIVLPTYNDDQEKANLIREIYYDHKELLQLHKEVDELFGRNEKSDKMEQEESVTKQRERVRPVACRSEKMMMIAQDQEQDELIHQKKEEDQTKQMRSVEDKEVQTQKEVKEEGQIDSQQRSRSREKKKKKHKSKKKSKKKKDDDGQPKFSSDSQEKKRQRSNSRGNQNRGGDRDFKDRNDDNFNRDRGNRDNFGYNDNYNNRNGNDWGNRNDDSFGGRDNWGNRGSNNRNDRYDGNQDRGNFDRDNQRDRHRRDFSSYEQNNQNNRGFGGGFRGGDRGFGRGDDQGGFRGRGRGGGRGGRGGRDGRGGFNRDNNDRNDGSNQQNNDGGLGNNNDNRNQSGFNDAPKIQAPDQY